MKNSCLVLYLFLACFTLKASAQDCQNTAPASNSIIIKQTIATASIWANYWKQLGSINFEIKNMLHDAQTLLYLESSKNADCSKQIQRYISICSIPEKFIANDYADKDTCLERLNQTSLKPITYTNPNPRQIDQIIAEFIQISKGSGMIGEDIYRQCQGLCSPQYQIILKPLASGFQTQLEVICGPARDKENNNYILSTNLIEEFK